MSHYQGLAKSKTKRIFKHRDSISKHLQCSICSDVYEEPVRTICGHTFCYICIQQWACIKDKCPLCKDNFKKRKLEPDRIAKAIIDDFIVQCFYTGCHWSNLESLRTKHQRTCTFKPKNSALPSSANVVEITDQVITYDLISQPMDSEEELNANLAIEPVNNFVNLNQSRMVDLQQINNNPWINEGNDLPIFEQSPQIYNACPEVYSVNLAGKGSLKETKRNDTL